ncbi:MAG: helix-turn-helix domain-containing protein [Verrucomicrobiota bacterium]
MQLVDARKSFGLTVKAGRKRRGLSQEELAERAGLQRSYVADVERGSRNLSLENITRLARALRVRVADLFPERNELVNILLVDDERDDVDVTLSAFKKARFANRVQVVSDGQAALDHLFRAGKYADSPGGSSQVVLLNLHLPKLSGLDFLRCVRADERTRAIPVVVLTFKQVLSDIAECQRLGVKTFIRKPLNFETLSRITPRLNLDWALIRPARRLQ